MTYGSAIYGGYDDPQIVYVDRTVIVSGGGGGGDIEYVGNNIQEEKIIYKDPVFPKLKIRKMMSQNIKVKITVLKFQSEEK